MDPQIHLSVTFRGGTQSFLVSDSSNTTWADVEAMVSPLSATRANCRREDSGVNVNVRITSSISNSWHDSPLTLWMAWSKWTTGTACDSFGEICFFLL